MNKHMTIFENKYNANHVGRYLIKIFLLMAIVILSSQFTFSLRISEIMFNPDGLDAGREWIKIDFNESEGCINLTDYKLFEESTNHNIYAYEENKENIDENSTDKDCEYAIICNDINKFLQDYAFLNSTDALKKVHLYKSTFSLSNTGEELAIKHNSEFIDYINYTTILSYVSVAEGHSLVLENDVWQSSKLINGTLRNNNIDYSNNSTPINTTLNQTELNLTEILIENNTALNITNTTNTNTQNTDINNESDNINESNTTKNDNTQNCNASIYISIKNESIFYENNAQIKFYNKLEFNYMTNTSTNTVDNTENTETNNYSIDYWIEDLSGNIIKNKVTTTNQDEKSFTPKIDESDKIFIIKNYLRYTYCNTTRNSSEKIILIKNSNYIPLKSSSCPTCNCKTTSASVSTAVSEGTFDKSVTDCSLNTQKPIIKTVNVCNNSGSTDKSEVARNTSQSVKLQTTNLNTGTLNSSDITQSTGKTTGMIVYESPNLKNRLYALIGLILVGLTCLVIIGYKIYVHKTSTNT